MGYAIYTYKTYQAQYSITFTCITHNINTAQNTPCVHVHITT